MSSRRVFLALFFVLGGALTSCVTPSVPIPPPEPERMVFEYDGANGEATFTFDPTPSYANAIVYIYNRDRGVGIIETAAADGSVGPTRTFSGDIGDHVVITFDLETQLATTCVELQQGRSSSTRECVP